jgi:membrane protein YdbS with pleckstrin-like domain
MRSVAGRPRYFLIITSAYMVIGLVIIARALLTGATTMIILGAVFLLLAAVRFRDYRRWRTQVP